MAGVEINDTFVRRTLADGRVEEVAWNELAEVRIITMADGSFSDELFFVLIGATGKGCVVPYSAADRAFLTRLQALPGFDRDKVVEARLSMADRQLLVWRRAGNRRPRAN
ncbi:hypothetical protein [Nocardia huaxiensis]|uniref:Uncharacterized protein n=1 Tax=Nocardia huaxiensis TaxID=2755382 RepID=A0A7D6VAZ0_9NOCA|nr:hypothetical protein [Nocardia huaxiensis]QLY32072.1 hypothetical protein H0264_07210 [Nocardia huaxiensis]UFS95650.1 hypothetical protein LPY97_34090 [Nocardia huaxiensis]